MYSNTDTAKSSLTIRPGMNVGKLNKHLFINLDLFPGSLKMKKHNIMKSWQNNPPQKKWTLAPTALHLATVTRMFEQEISVDLFA